MHLVISTFEYRTAALHFQFHIVGAQMTYNVRNHTLRGYCQLIAFLGKYEIGTKTS